MSHVRAAFALGLAIVMATLVAPIAARAQDDAASVFAVRYERGPNWRDDVDLADQPGFAEHARFVRELADKGSLLLGGPFADLKGGLSILRARSIDEARALVRSDPLIAGGALRASVDEWLPRVGSGAFLALLSAGAGNEPADARPSDAAKPLVHSAVIDAPLDEVWRAFTTKQGVEAWMVPLAQIDLRKGGSLRTTYNPDDGLDGPSAIVHEFLDVQPMRRLSMRVVQCPRDFPWAHLLEQTWSDIEFEPVGERATRVAITGYGYKTGGDWDRMRQFFDEGNALEMQRLADLFSGHEAAHAGTRASDHPSDSARIMRELRKFVGGEWIHESATPDGGVFRVRNVARLGPDGVSVVSRGWLGDADGMYEHAATVVYRDPATGEARFFNVSDKGAIARGPITLLDDGVIRWAGREVSALGERRYQMDMRFTGDDAYDFSVVLLSDAGPQRLAQASFRRVERAPERFRTLRKQIGKERSMGSVKIDTWTDGAVTVVAKRESPTMRWSRFEAIVPASQREVWERFTTAQGMRTFFCQAANIDLRPGGAYEPLFFPDNPPGERGGEGVTFRDLDEPNGFSLNWNAPPQFPEVRATGFRARLEFEPIDHATTRVRVTLDEFRAGAQWDGTYDYFLKAWAVVLNRLRRSYTEGPIDWALEYAPSRGG